MVMVETYLTGAANPLLLLCDTNNLLNAVQFDNASICTGSVTTFDLRTYF